MYFSATTATEGKELWKTDGTLAGTSIVKDIMPGTLNSIGATNSYAFINGIVYFVGFDALNGFELWKTDGTDAGTSMVANINPEVNNSSPTNLTAIGTTLFFTATEVVHNSELWKLETVVAAGSTTWTGNISDVWENAGNWSNGVPGSTTDVIIPAGRPNYPVIRANTSVKSINSFPGTSVQVATGISIIINGN